MCNELLNNKEYINYQTGEKLDLERASNLKENCIIKITPELWCEWDFEKNEALGYNIWKMTKGSHKKAHWICPDCASEYDMRIQQRSRGQNCPYCRGVRTNHTNSLTTSHPELAKEWHFTKNGKLTPNDVTYGSSKKVWWICRECNRDWESMINNRSTKNRGCPRCKGTNQTFRDVNDMWTTNPELASLLANPEDGYRYMQSSNQKVDWKCPCCGDINSKVISSVRFKGLNCPSCSDNFSLPEKLMSILLLQLKVIYKREISFEWSNNKRYDFYLPLSSVIIEVNGMQHYGKTFDSLGGRTLEEEQLNDQYKYKMAITNGIEPENYIVIDCRKSDFEFIKTNILNSRLAEIFDLSDINWLTVFKESQKSIVNKVCVLFNKNCFTIKEISEKANISIWTVYEYLKSGTLSGLCNYVPKSKAQTDISKTKTMKAVVKIDKFGNYIETFPSITEAAKSVDGGKNASSISLCCKNKLQFSCGFKWMYLADYEKLISENKKVHIKKIKNAKSRPIVKLDIDSNYVSKYDSISEATREIGGIYKSVLNSISACCTGKQRTAKGYKWLYIEDYEKMIEEQNKIS